MTRVFVVEDQAIVAMEIKDHQAALGCEVCGHSARGEAAPREIPAQTSFPSTPADARGHRERLAARGVQRDVLRPAPAEPGG